MSRLSLRILFLSTLLVLGCYVQAAEVEAPGDQIASSGTLQYTFGRTASDLEKDITLVGTAKWDKGTSKHAGILMFDGTSGTYASLQPTYLAGKSFSFRMFVKVLGTPDTQKNSVFFLLASASSKGLKDQISLSRDGITNDFIFSIQRGTEAPQQLKLTNAISFNTWMHLVITQTPTGIVSVFKDGKLLKAQKMIYPDQVYRDVTYLGGVKTLAALDANLNGLIDTFSADLESSVTASQALAFVSSDLSVTQQFPDAGERKYEFKNVGDFGSLLAGGATLDAGSTQHPGLAQLNGNKQFIDLEGLTFGEKTWSASMWVKITAASVDTQKNAKFFEFASGEEGAFSVGLGRDGVTNNLIYTLNENYNPRTVVANNVLTLNEWINLAVTQDATGTVTLFKNGKVVASAVLPLPAKRLRQYTYLGRSSFHGDAYLQGQIDSFTFNYDIAYAPSAVTTAYTTDVMAMVTASAPAGTSVTDGVTGTFQYNFDSTTPNNGALLVPKEIFKTVPESTFHGSIIDLSGQSQYVDLGVTFFGDKSYSVRFWLKIPTGANQNNAGLFSFYTADGGDIISLKRDGTTNALVYSVSVGTSTPSILKTAANTILLDSWMNVIVSHNSTAGVTTIYRNGAVVGTGTMATPKKVVRANSFVGRGVTAADAFFKGQLDGFNINFDSIVSAADAVEIFNSEDPVPTVGERAFDFTPTSANPLGTNVVPVGGVQAVNDGPSHSNVISFNSTIDGLDLGYTYFGDSAWSIRMVIQTKRDLLGIPNAARFIEFAAKVDGTTDALVIARKDKTTDVVVFISRETVSQQVTIPSLISEGVWMDLVFVQNTKGNVVVYKNGQVVFTSTNSLPFPRKIYRKYTFVGKSVLTTVASFRGKLDTLTLNLYGEMSSTLITGLYQNQTYVAPSTGTTELPLKTLADLTSRNIILPSGVSLLSNSDGPFANAISFAADAQPLALPTMKFGGAWTVRVWVKSTAVTTSTQIDTSIFSFSTSGDEKDSIVFRRMGSGSGLQLVMTQDRFPTDAPLVATLTCAGNYLATNVWNQFIVSQSTTGTATVYRNGVKICSGLLPVPRDTIRDRNFLGLGAKTFQGVISAFNVQFGKTVTDVEAFESEQDENPTLSVGSRTFHFNNASGLVNGATQSAGNVYHSGVVTLDATKKAYVDFGYTYFGGSAWSARLWFLATTITNSPIFSFSSADSANSIALTTSTANNNSLVLTITNNKISESLTAATSFPVGKWVAVDIVHASSLDLYIIVNTAVVATKKMNFPLKAYRKNCYLGQSLGNTGSTFNGQLDNIFFFFDRALDLSVTTSVYTNEIPVLSAGSRDYTFLNKAKYGEVLTAATYNAGTNLNSGVVTLSNVTTGSYVDIGNLYFGANSTTDSTYQGFTLRIALKFNSFSTNSRILEFSAAEDSFLSISLSTDADTGRGIVFSISGGLTAGKRDLYNTVSLSASNVFQKDFFSDVVITQKPDGTVSLYKNGKELSSAVMPLVPLTYRSFCYIGKSTSANVAGISADVDLLGLWFNQVLTKDEVNILWNKIAPAVLSGSYHYKFDRSGEYGSSLLAGANRIDNNVFHPGVITLGGSGAAINMSTLWFGDSEWSIRMRILIKSEGVAQNNSALWEFNDGKAEASRFGLYRHFATNNLRFELSQYGKVYRIITAGDFLIKGVWLDIIVTQDVKQAVKIYINGNALNVASSSFGTTFQYPVSTPRPNCFVGRSTVYTTAPSLIADVDAISIYSTSAMTDAEILRWTQFDDEILNVNAFTGSRLYHFPAVDQNEWGEGYINSPAFSAGNYLHPGIVTLNGVNQSLSLGSTYFGAPADPNTKWEGWSARVVFRTKTDQKNVRIFEIVAGENNDNAVILTRDRANGNDLRVLIQVGIVAYNVSVVGVIEFNKWLDITITQSAATKAIKVYKNGNIVASTVTGTPVLPQRTYRKHAWVGRGADPSMGHLNADIDSFTIYWDSVLTDKQILDTYNQMEPPTATGEWKYDLIAASEIAQGNNVSSTKLRLLGDAKVTNGDDYHPGIVILSGNTNSSIALPSLRFGAQPFSFRVRMMLTSKPKNAPMFVLSDKKSYSQISLARQGETDDLELKVVEGVTISIVTTTKPLAKINQWMDIVVTQNSNFTLSLYIDSTLVASKTLGGFLLFEFRDANFIGRDLAGSVFTACIVDSFTFYADRAMTVAEINRWTAFDDSIVTAVTGQRDYKFETSPTFGEKMMNLATADVGTVLHPGIVHLRNESAHVDLGGLYFGGNSYGMRIIFRLTTITQNARLLDFSRSENSLNGITISTMDNNEDLLYSVYDGTVANTFRIPKVLDTYKWIDLFITHTTTGVTAYKNGFYVANATMALPKLAYRKFTFLGRSTVSTQPTFFSSIDQFSLFLDPLAIPTPNVIAQLALTTEPPESKGAVEYKFTSGSENGITLTGAATFSAGDEFTNGLITTSVLGSNGINLGNTYFGDGPWGIKMRLRLNTTAEQNNARFFTLMDKPTYADSVTSIVLYRYGITNDIKLTIHRDKQNYTVATSGGKNPFTPGVWMDLVVTQDANRTVYIYKDGQQLVKQVIPVFPVKEYRKYCTLAQGSGSATEKSLSATWDRFTIHYDSFITPDQAQAFTKFSDDPVVVKTDGTVSTTVGVRNFEFKSSTPSSLNERFVGAPTVSAGSSLHPGQLILNGVNQYVALPSSHFGAVDWSVRVGFKVDNATSARSKTLFAMAADADGTDSFTLTFDDNLGLVVTIKNLNSAAQSVTAVGVNPRVWNDVFVTQQKDGSLRIYNNGTLLRFANATAAGVAIQPLRPAYRPFAFIGRAASVNFAATQLPCIIDYFTLWFTTAVSAADVSAYYTLVEPASSSGVYHYRFTVPPTNGVITDNSAVLEGGAVWSTNNEYNPGVVTLNGIDGAINLGNMTFGAHPWAARMRIKVLGTGRLQADARLFEFHDLLGSSISLSRSGSTNYLYFAFISETGRTYSLTTTQEVLVNNNRWIDIVINHAANGDVTIFSNTVQVGQVKNVPLPIKDRRGFCYVGRGYGTAPGAYLNASIDVFSFYFDREISVNETNAFTLFDDTPSVVRDLGSRNYTFRVANNPARFGEQIIGSPSWSRGSVLREGIILLNGTQYVSLGQTYFGAVTAPTPVATAFTFRVILRSALTAQPGAPIIEFSSGENARNAIGLYRGQVNQLVYRINDGFTSREVVFDNMIVAGAWSDIVLTHSYGGASGSAVNLYLNGKKVTITSTAAGFAIPSLTFRKFGFIGRSSVATAPLLVADIDYASIHFDSAMNDATVTALSLEPNTTIGVLSYDFTTDLTGAIIRPDTTPLDKVGIEYHPGLLKLTGTGQSVLLPKFYSGATAWAVRMRVRVGAVSNTNAASVLDSAAFFDFNDCLDIPSSVALHRQGVSNDIQLTIRQEGKEYTLSTTTSPLADTDIWMDIVVQQDVNGTAFIYRDGFLLASSKLALPYKEVRACNYIGTRHNANVYFKGQFDSFTLYHNRALTLEEIQRFSFFDDQTSVAKNSGTREYKFSDITKPDFAESFVNLQATNFGAGTYLRPGQVQFNGQNQFANLGVTYFGASPAAGVVSNNSWSGFTLSVGLKPVTAAVGSAIFSASLSDNTHNSMLLSFGPAVGDVTFAWYVASTRYELKAINVTKVNEWNDIVITQTGQGNTTLFVNGVRRANAVTAAIPLAYRKYTYVGRSALPSASFLEATIDYFTLRFDTVIGAASVAEEYSVLNPVTAGGRTQLDFLNAPITVGTSTFIGLQARLMNNAKYLAGDVYHVGQINFPFGSSAHIDLGTMTTGGKPWSVRMRFKLNALAVGTSQKNARFFEMSSENTLTSFLLARSGTTNELQFVIKQNGVNSAFTTTTFGLAVNAWTDLFITQNTTGVTVIYKNGVEIARSTTMPLVVAATRTKNWVGRSSTVTDDYLAADVDEFTYFAETCVTAVDVSRWTKFESDATQDPAIDTTEVSYSFDTTTTQDKAEIQIGTAPHTGVMKVDSTKSQFGQISPLYFGSRTSWPGWSARVVFRLSGTAVGGQRLLDLSMTDTGRDSIVLARDATDLTAVVFTVNTGLTASSLIVRNILVQDDWIDIAVTQDASSKVTTIYKNGASVLTSSTVALPALTYRKYNFVGRPATPFLNGLIDVVSIHPHGVWTPNQVLQTSNLAMFAPNQGSKPFNFLSASAEGYTVTGATAVAGSEFNPGQIAISSRAGVASSVSLGSHMFGGKSWSILLRLRLTTIVGNYANIFSLSNNLGSNSITLGRFSVNSARPNDLILTITQNNAASYVNATNAFTSLNGTWVDIVVSQEVFSTYATTRIYINGATVATTNSVPAAVLDNRTKCVVGGINLGQDKLESFWTGFIDLVQFNYESAVSAEKDAQTLYDTDGVTTVSTGVRHFDFTTSSASAALKFDSSSTLAVVPTIVDGVIPRRGILTLDAARMQYASLGGAYFGASAGSSWLGFTMRIVVKVTGTAAAQRNTRFIELANAENTGVGVALLRSGNTTDLTYRICATTSIASCVDVTAPNVLDNEWSDFVVTHTVNGTVNIYKNGELALTRDRVDAPALKYRRAGAVGGGTFSAGTADYLTGQVDLVSLYYDQVLSPATISDLAEYKASVADATGVAVSNFRGTSNTFSSVTGSVHRGIISLDGSKNNFAKLSPNAGFFGSQSYSIALRIKITAAVTGSVIFHTSNLDGTRFITMRRSGSTSDLVLSIVDGVTVNNLNVASALLDNQWLDLVVSHATNGLAVYSNAKRVLSVTNVAIPALEARTKTFVGRGATVESANFTGLVDFVRVYQTVALTQDQVTNMYLTREIAAPVATPDRIYNFYNSITPDWAEFYDSDIASGMPPAVTSGSHPTRGVVQFNATSSQYVILGGFNFGNRGTAWPGYSLRFIIRGPATSRPTPIFASAAEDDERDAVVVSRSGNDIIYSVNVGTKRSEYMIKDVFNATVTNFTDLIVSHTATGSLIVYRDGKQFLSTAANVVAAPANIPRPYTFIGRGCTDSTAYFTGELDLFAIYPDFVMSLTRSQELNTLALANVDPELRVWNFDSTDVLPAIINGGGSIQGGNSFHPGQFIFNGSSANARLGDIAFGANGWSIQIRLRLNQLNHGNVFFHSGTTNGRNITLQRSTFSIQLALTNPIETVDCTSIPPIGLWHDIVVTQNSTGLLTMYIHGISCTSWQTAYTGRLNRLHNFIGRGPTGNEAALVAAIDTYKVWTNRALTAAEATALTIADGQSLMALTGARTYDFEDAIKASYNEKARGMPSASWSAGSSPNLGVVTMNGKTADNQYIDLGQDLYFGGTSWTIRIVFKPTGAVSDQNNARVFSLGVDETMADSIVLYRAGTSANLNLQVFSSTGVSLINLVAGTITQDVWNDFVIVRNGGVITVYKNKAVSASAVANTRLRLRSCAWIGRGPNMATTDNNLRAEIDVFQLWGDSALNADEISYLYESRLYAVVTGTRSYKFQSNGEFGSSLSTNAPRTAGNVVHSGIVTLPGSTTASKIDLAPFNFGPNTGLSIRMRVQVTAAAASQRNAVFIGFFSSNNKFNFYLARNGITNGVVFAVSQGSTNYTMLTSTDNVITQGSWLDLTVTQDADGNTNIYRGAVSVANGKLPVIGAGARVTSYIGDRIASTDSYASIIVDDVDIMIGRVLTVTDLAQWTIMTASAVSAATNGTRTYNFDNINAPEFASTYVGGATIYNDYYPHSSSVRLSGSNQYVSLGATNFGSGGSWPGFSLRFAIRMNADGTSQNNARLIELASDEKAVDGIAVMRSGTTNDLSLRITKSDLTFSELKAVNVLTRDWLDIVVTVSSSGAAVIYVNGVSRATGTVTVPSKVVRRFGYLGQFTTTTGGEALLNADIDQFTLYSDSVLTSADVDTLASAFDTTPVLMSYNDYPEYRPLSFSTSNVDQQGDIITTTTEIITISTKN